MLSFLSRLICVINQGVDDIEEIIKSAQNMKYHEDAVFSVNLISSLPETKPRMKKAIKERIKILYTGYISLATFIPDEEYENFKKSKSARRRIYRKMIRDHSDFCSTQS